MRRKHPDVDAARERVQLDSREVEKHAQRIERSADDLERRLDTNHISESVASLIRRAATR